METELNASTSPPNEESIAAMNPLGQDLARETMGTTNSYPGSLAAPNTPKNAAPTAGKLSKELSGRDRVLLELLVHMSLRLRLRGVDLESATGLSGRELDLVALLTSSGPTSVKSLVADLGLPRSTMTAIVDRLQERELVIRHPNPEDRRSVILEATPAAVEALRRYHEGMLGLVDHIKKVLPDAEQDEFTRLVHKMADSF